MRRRDWIISGAAGAVGAARAEPLQVVYPRFAGAGLESLGYRVLEAALNRSGLPHELRLHAEMLSTPRLLNSLDEGLVSVVDGGASLAYEQRYLTVYCPIDMGLSGFRQFVVRTAAREALSALRTIEDLRRYRLGQGVGWSDLDVLRGANLNVVAAESSSLFRMLEGGRFDLLPLGVMEAEGLLKAHASQAPSAVLLPQPLLHYPFARLFFVSPKQPELAQALMEGLQALHADGSLLHLLASLPGVGPLLRGQVLAERAVIPLTNLSLSERVRALPRRWLIAPPGA